MVSNYEVRTDIGTVRTDIGTVRTDMQTGFKNAEAGRAVLQSNMNVLQSNMDEGFKAILKRLPAAADDTAKQSATGRRQPRPSESAATRRASMKL